MKIDITQEDINNGIPRNHECCPVALAIKRCFKTDLVLVNGRRAMFTKFKPMSLTGGAIEAYQYEMPLPENVQFFISMFDKGVGVGPISFEAEEQLW